MILIMIIIHPPQTNKKASNKKLDSQISYFSKRTRDLITRSNENSLLRNKKSRLSLEKSYFLLDRGGCMDYERRVLIHMNMQGSASSIDMDFQTDIFLS